MTTVSQASEYLSRRIEQGFSDYQIKICTSELNLYAIEVASEVCNVK